MTVALCLGGAACVRDDWARALSLGDFDFVVACNDAGAIWPGRLDAWVTLHPEKLTDWREQRRANGFPDAGRNLVHGADAPDWAELVEYRFPGQNDSGSSGLFTAKAALIDLGADRAVLAGIPLIQSPHFFDAVQWQEAGSYRAAWEALRPCYRSRIRSMSGWTAHFFGTPTTEWLATGATDADAPNPTMESNGMSKIILDKIAYEPHPVSPERKRELNAQGYKVIDAIFAPADGGRDPLDHDGNGRKGGAAKQEPSAELAELRAAYKEKLNKNPFMGWDAETLKAKIAEAAGA